MWMIHGAKAPPEEAVERPPLAGAQGKGRQTPLGIIKARYPQPRLERWPRRQRQHPRPTSRPQALRPLHT